METSTPTGQPAAGPSCASCGAEMGQARFCPECGEPAPAPRASCADCGHRPEGEPVFCPECGAKLPAPC